MSARSCARSFLASVRREHRAVTVRLRVVILISGLILLPSCQNPADDSAADSSPAVRQLLSVLSEDNSLFEVPGIAQFPRDLSTHQRTRTESFLLQGIVSVTKEEKQLVSPLPTGIMLRIDRVALTPGNNELPADSAWRYSGVMRSSVFVDTPLSNLHKNVSATVVQAPAHLLAELATVERRQSVQRMALGLAGVTANSLWVGDDRITISQLDGSSDSCARAYRWQATLSVAVRVEFDVSLTQCPQPRSLRAFNSWQQTSPDVTGVLITRGEAGEEVSTALEGFAWISQSWGDLPASGGAVAIDFLQIKLDDSRWLDVSRSKRRSGRGPKTVSATLRAEGLEPRSISVTWEDNDESQLSDSGNSYPGIIMLRTVDPDLALSVRVMNRLSESSDTGESRLEVPVMVTGTHAGSGFLSFHPLAQ